jgi:hypothetical protein
MTASEIFDLDLKEMSVKEAEEEREREQRLAAERAEREGQLVAAEVELFHARVEQFSSRPMHWVRTRKGAWVLSLGDLGQLRMASAGGDIWSVTLVQTEARHRLRDGLPLSYAQGYGEDYARQSGAKALVDPRSSWRKEPASPGQLRFLAKLREPVVPEMTKGEAGDVLTSITGDW